MLTVIDMRWTALMRSLVSTAGGGELFFFDLASASGDAIKIDNSVSAVISAFITLILNRARSRNKQICRTTFGKWLSVIRYQEQNQIRLPN